jgi:protein-histidine pros-kinase
MRLFRPRDSADKSESIQPNVADLLEAAPDAIIIVDTGGTIVVINSQAEVLFGYVRQELIGKSIEILIPARFGDLHVKHRASFTAAPRVRPMGAGLTLFGKRKNGAEFPVEISLSPVRTPQGIFIISAIRDVTDRKHAEEQIKRLNAELGAALRRSEQVGRGSDVAVTIAQKIDVKLDMLLRLLSEIERRSEPAIRDIVGEAREEIDQMSQVTAEAISLQNEHEAWRKS